MPLTATDLLGQISNTSGNFGTGAFTTGSFTPPDSSFLVVGVVAIENGGADALLTDLTISGGSLTFAPAKSQSADTAFSTGARLYTAAVTTGSSMTITVDCGTRNIAFYAVTAAAYTGYDTGTPVGATAAGAQSGGFSGPPTPASITLDGSPATTSEVVALVGMDKPVAGTEPATGWTEQHQLQNTDWGGLQLQTRTASTSTTVGWDDLRSGGGALFNYAAVAIEVRARTVVDASLSGSITATGTVAKQMSRNLTGSTTGTGALTKVAAKALTATVTATGTLVRLVSKVVAGSVTATGVATKLVSRLLGGSVTPTGSVATAVPTPTPADATNYSGPQRATHYRG